MLPANRIGAYLENEGAHLLHYEVIDATVGKYTTAGNGFATVEIFRFPDFVKAFGAYSTTKKGPVRFLDVPNEAYASKFGVHLWRGPFYVRVVGNGGPGGSQAVEALARFVADRMPAAPGKPAVFNFFPNDVRVVNSERYSSESGFDQPILANSFQATFNSGGSPVEGLIIPAADKAAAQRIMEAYRQLYIRNGRLLDPVINLGEDNFTAEDKYLGRAVTFRIDRFVIAFNGFTDRQRIVDLATATDARILGTIRKQLVTAEKQAENPPEKTNTAAPPWAR